MNREERLQLICDNYNRIVKHLRGLGVDDNDAEDLAGDTLFDACRAVDRLRDESSVFPWLRTIADNKAKRYFKKKMRRREISNMVRIEAGEIDLYDFTADELTVERILQQAEENMMVERLLERLPKVNRQIVRMRFWGGYKFPEMADILGLNLNTVKSLYRRSLKRLEKEYRQDCGREEDHG
ncbi:MAG: sigma-70 family RNA polymerase sigma factor [Bacillota bacterium]|nr:sigma-70 family RNA polymerase sigma factor [Bacillota bacterium]